MPWGRDRHLALALFLAAACRPEPATENPYSELPPPDVESEAPSTVDERVDALEQRTDAAAERAAAVAEEARRQSALPSCGCEGAQACRVRCEAPNEPRCACEPMPRCECVAGPVSGE